jgi:hypothetical protein
MFEGIFFELKQRVDSTAGPLLVCYGAFTRGAAVIFKILNDYSTFAMANLDHPAHEAVRNRLLKGRHGSDARLRAPVRREARRVRSAATVEVHTTVDA